MFVLVCIASQGTADGSTGSTKRRSRGRVGGAAGQAQAAMRPRGHVRGERITTHADTETELRDPRGEETTWSEGAASRATAHGTRS